MTFNKTGLAKLARKYHLKQVLLFGSQSSEQTTPKSDFDIGILAEKPLSSPRKDKLLIELSQNTGLPIQKIDLTFLNQASPLLLFESMTKAKPLYGHPGDFEDFKLYAIKRYQDHQKFFDLQRRYLTKQYAQ